MTSIENKMTAQFRFMGYKEEDIVFEVQPKVYDDIEFDISIRPKNGMTAIYDLVETPTVTLPINPIEDTYITTESPYNSINEGDARSMLIGNDSKGEHRGLIKFDLSFVDPNLYFKDAKLRIYYSNLITDASFSLYTVNGEWSEYSVTYLNKPNINEFLTNEYTINREESYIEFNVFEIVEKWIKGIPTDGFYLLSDSNASTFRTRESSLSPVLLVEYKDPLPPKITYSKTEFEIAVKALGDNSIEFELEVDESYSNEDIEFEVFAHDPNNVYTEDIEFELESIGAVYTDSNDDIEWEVISANSDFNIIEWEVTVEEKEGNNDVEWDIEVSELDKEDNSDVEWDINILQPDETQEYNDVEWDINVIRPPITSSSDLEFDIIVNIYTENSDVEFDLGVYHQESSDLEFELELGVTYEHSDIEFEIAVQGYEYSDIEFELTVPHSDIEFDVTPLFSGDNNIEFDILPRVPYVEDIEIEINVPEYLGDTEIEFEVESLASTRKKYSYSFII